jgi:stage IV sporulation protein FB
MPLISEPGSTPLDLNFRLGRIPVRVSPWFWVGSVFLGWNFLKIGFEYLLIWVACVFFSILLHELGHVLMGQVFGTRGHIVLQAMGGLAIGSSDLYNRWKRIAVILAGPGIQLILYGLLRAGLEFDVIEPRGLNRYVLAALGMLLTINLWWPILNLLPIWPLDGGQISRELFTWVVPANGVRYSLVVSILTAGLLAVNALVTMIRDKPLLDFLPTGDRVFILFFALFAIESYLLLQQENARRTHWHEPDDRLPWESDPDEWKRR